jgi:glycosyltransferase involved in cell wall biosynthesis
VDWVYKVCTPFISFFYSSTHSFSFPNSDFKTTHSSNAPTRSLISDLWVGSGMVCGKSGWKAIVLMGIQPHQIRVGHPIFAFKEGGMERSLLNLINYGNQDKFFHIIICLTDADHLADLITSKNCRIIKLQKKEGNDYTLPFAIAKIIHRHNIEILHARGWPTMVETILAAFSKKRVKTIYGFHGKTAMDLGSPLSKKRGLAQTCCAKFYDKMVTLNKAMQRELAEDCGMKNDQIAIIANGVDVAKFFPIKGKSSLREKYGLPKGSVIVGNVARLDSVKNHEVVLRTIKRLKEKNQEVFFLLVGEGERRKFLEDEVSRLQLQKNVRFFGRSNQICELINCMDIFIQSSWYEGFCNTMLEAMACGVPVLASKVGGNQDIMASEHDRFLFDPQDDSQLEDLINEFMCNPGLGSNVGDQVRHHVVEKYSIKWMVKKYEDLYSDLVGLAGS